MAGRVQRDLVKNDLAIHPELGPSQVNASRHLGEFAEPQVLGRSPFVVLVAHVQGFIALPTEALRDYCGDGYFVEEGEAVVGACEPGLFWWSEGLTGFEPSLAYGVLKGLAAKVSAEEFGSCGHAAQRSQVALRARSKDM